MISFQVLLRNMLQPLVALILKPRKEQGVKKQMRRVPVPPHRTGGCHTTLKLPRSQWSLSLLPACNLTDNLSPSPFLPPPLQCHLRMTPLKASWVQLIDPIVEHMKLQAGHVDTVTSC